MSVPLQVLRDGGAQESEWLHCSHSAVHDGEWRESRGVPPEVHNNLHSFERVKLQVVKTAPDSQLFNPFNKRIKYTLSYDLSWLLWNEQSPLKSKPKPQA